VTVILHLVPAEAWRAKGPGEPWSPPSLATEGFVHCTDDDDTLLRVANTFYRDEPGDLLVLSLDVDRLTSPTVWEAAMPAPPEGAQDVRFPHVYGPIDEASVVGVRRMLREVDGTCRGYGPID
jgi:uncharacterized protein (DUF952 family)